MELIRYQKTLDVHKNGTQFVLQGFETADKLSRIIEISLMASGDAIDFPLEGLIAMMHVASPGATEPSIYPCEIKDNKVIYNVLPIKAEGITTMQLELLEGDIEGAKRVLVSPKFAVEVTNSETNEDGEELKAEFTAIQDFIVKAEKAYESRLERIELTNDCIFKAYYYDGSTYETDILKNLFHGGNSVLSESFAHGGTGTRVDEDTDNAMYYSNLSKSEALNAKDIMKNSEEILEEVRKHGLYTTFSVNFDTGEVEYVSPSFDFSISKETGEIEAKARAYTFEATVYDMVDKWIAEHGVSLEELQKKAKNHDADILAHEKAISELQEDAELIPIERGGTGGTTADEALSNLGALSYSKYEYIGDGKAGPDNANSYTFEGNLPKLVMLCDLNGGYNVIFPYGQETVRFVTYTRLSTSRNNGFTLHLTYEDKKMTWYGTDDEEGASSEYYYSAFGQFNSDGSEYKIIFIY